MNPQELEDGLFFSVISKSPANTLHWKLVKGSGSTTAGEEVLPGEKFAYYWDKEKKTFWFATVRAISWTNTSLWTLDKMEFKGDGIKATEGFESDSALPPAFRDNIRQIWK